MNINIIQIVLICILSGLAWWVNEKLNTVPILKTVIQVLIVVVAVLLLLQSLGVLGSLNTHVRIG
jgi:Na+/H+-dicarboxylate symporter